VSQKLYGVLGADLAPDRRLTRLESPSHGRADRRPDDVKHYAVAELDVTDPAWVADYVTHTTRLVEAHGGRYLARTPRVDRLEGERDPRTIFLLIEWPSKEAAEAFYESEEYRPYRERRIAGSNGEFFLVAGEDVNGVARIAD